MKTTLDVRLSTQERALLSQMIGKKFEVYKCDEFHFRPAVYQLVTFSIEGRVFALENKTHLLNYFGSKEDVSVLSIRGATSEDTWSRVRGGHQVETPIGQVVRDVVLFDDRHTMFDGDEALFEYIFTKAVVFVFDDRRLVFEKDCWMSEDIFVYRGANVDSKITPVETEIEESGENEFRGERTRQSLLGALES